MHFFTICLLEIHSCSVCAYNLYTVNISLHGLIFQNLQKVEKELSVKKISLIDYWTKRNFSKSQPMFSLYFVNFELFMVIFLGE